MNIRIILLGILLVISSYIIGQDLAATVSVNRDSILLGNTLTLSVTVNGQKIQNLDLDLPDNLEVISGPNISTSMTMINGDITQTSIYNYVIKPSEVGTDYIPPLVINTSQGDIETQPITLNTYPNPLNIIQEDGQLGANFGSLFDLPMDSPFGSEQRQFDFGDFFGGDFQSLFDHPMLEQLNDQKIPTPEEKEHPSSSRTLKRI